MLYAGIDSHRRVFQAACSTRTWVSFTRAGSSRPHRFAPRILRNALRLRVLSVGLRRFTHRLDRQGPIAAYPRVHPEPHSRRVRPGLGTHEAIRRGITHSAGVISSAAVVMVGVFATLATLSVVTLTYGVLSGCLAPTIHAAPTSVPSIKHERSLEPL
jgi:hypothetical protein